MAAALSKEPPLPRPVFWPFLAVSRFCQMTSLTSPPVTSWGSASRQSAKQAVYCLWCRECGAMSETLSASYHLCGGQRPQPLLIFQTPRGSLPLAGQVKWGCGLDSGKGICAVFSRRLPLLCGGGSCSQRGTRRGRWRRALSACGRRRGRRVLGAIAVALLSRRRCTRRRS